MVTTRGFVLSVPKAGTYFVSEILKIAGLAQTFLHVAEHGYEDYGRAPLAEGRRRPEAVHHAAPMAEPLARVPPGGFAVGHLAHSAEAVALLSDFRVVFLKRDPRLCLISRMRFQWESGRAAGRRLPWAEAANPRERLHAFLCHEGAAILAHLRALAPWPGEPNVLPLRFEELTGADGATVVVRLLDWFGLETGLTPAEVLHRALAADTLTKSSGRTGLDLWDETCETWWRRAGGPELMRIFGYA